MLPRNQVNDLPCQSISDLATAWVMLYNCTETSTVNMIDGPMMDWVLTDIHPPIPCRSKKTLVIETACKESGIDNLFKYSINILSCKYKLSRYWQHATCTYNAYNFSKHTHILLKHRLPTPYWDGPFNTLPSTFSLSLMCCRLQPVSSLLNSGSGWYDSSLEWAFLRIFGLVDTQQEVVLPILQSR